MSKKAAKDQLFIEELRTVAATLPHRIDDVDFLLQHNITTYGQLYTVIGDEQQSDELRSRACSTVSVLYKTVDKRSAVPPLLKTLKSPKFELFSAAGRALGMLGSRQAIAPLLATALDKSQPELHRIDSIYDLGMIRDNEAAIPAFVKLSHDQAESVRVRSQAIETSTALHDYNGIEDYIALLSDALPDIRFWASYGLARWYQRGDFVQAREKLDQIVAYDHTLPATWGWHVDREALCPLEVIYARLITNEVNYGFYLISPAIEYWTLSIEYRTMQENGYYTNQPTPPVELQIDPLWLKHQLEQRWQGLIFDIRQPPPQAYLLDWYLKIDDKVVMGALHWDQYAVVLTGDGELVVEFAVWYRSIIAPEHNLFLYEWADKGIQLKPNMSVTEINEGFRY